MVILVFLFDLMPEVPKVLLKQFLLILALEQAVRFLIVEFKQYQAHLVAYLTVPNQVSYAKYCCYQLEY